MEIIRFISHKTPQKTAGKEGSQYTLILSIKDIKASHRDTQVAYSTVPTVCATTGDGRLCNLKLSNGARKQTARKHVSPPNITQMLHLDCWMIIRVYPWITKILWHPS